MADSEPATDSSTRIAELIVAARAGSEAALGELMQYSRQYLLLIANEEMPDGLQAKGGPSDIVQETQMEAARGFPCFRGHTAAELLGWLREILLHNVKDFRRQYAGVAKRRASREISLSQSESGPNFAARLVADQSSPSGHCQHVEQVRAVEATIEQLPENYRQVVLWRHRDGCSFEEISERLDRSVGAVRKLWARAIRQLQERLKGLDER